MLLSHIVDATRVSDVRWSWRERLRRDPFAPGHWRLGTRTLKL